MKSGKAYYEFTFGERCGLGPQVGWAISSFEIWPESKDIGCGDQDDSYGIDGIRHALWHAGGHQFDVSWSPGDIIGVAIDLDAKKCFFGKNGEWKEGFSDMQKVDQGVFPCLTLDNTEICLNLGSAPFNFPGPTPDYGPVSTSDAALDVEQIRGYRDSFTANVFDPVIL